MDSLEAINKSETSSGIDCWGFTECQSKDKTLLFLAGGQTSSVSHTYYLWKLTPTEFRLETVGQLPTNAPINCSSVFDGGHSIYLFGGNDGSKHSNQLHRLDVSKRTWQLIAANGTPPEPRSSAFLTFANGRLFLFGGVNSKQTFVDLYSYDISSSSWTKLILSGGGPTGLVSLKPPPPDSAEQPTSLRPLAVSDGKKIHYLHEDFMSGRYSLWQLDLTTFQWKMDLSQTKHPKLRQGARLVFQNGFLLLVEGRYVDSGSVAGVMKLQLSKKLFNWPRERLLWLACYKNNPDECLLAKCPPIIIYKILTHLNERAKS